MKWLVNNIEQVVQLFVQHLYITFFPALLSFLICLPVGFFAFKHRKTGEFLVKAFQGLYAIPSLPLLVLVPAVFGLSLRSPLTLMLVLGVYGAALLVRSSADAFIAADAQTLEAATALGYGRVSRFWRVHLPLALPVILGGLRVVVVSTIALASIGALVGIPSLGTLLTDGFQRSLYAEVIVGLVSIVALATVADLFLLGITRLLCPWPRRESS